MSSLHTSHPSRHILKSQSRMPAFVPLPSIAYAQTGRRFSTTSTPLSISTTLRHDTASPESTPTVGPLKHTAQAPIQNPSPQEVPHALACGGDVAVVWLRDDLRVHDNASLHLASESGLQVAPLHILTSSSPDKFRCAALVELRSNLRRLGTTLYVRRGNSAETVVAFAQELGASIVYMHRGIQESARAEDRAAKVALSAAGIRLEVRWSGFVRDPDSLPFSTADTPTECDSYAMKVGSVKVPNVLPSPRALRGVHLDIDAGIIPDIGLENVDAGEAGAWRRVCEYVVGRGVAAVCVETRAVDTKFGRLDPFLKLGCVSPRAVYHEVIRKVPRMSLKFHCAELELLLSDFFKLCWLKEKAKVLRSTH